MTVTVFTKTTVTELTTMTVTVTVLTTMTVTELTTMTVTVTAYLDLVELRLQLLDQGLHELGLDKALGTCKSSQARCWRNVCLAL